MNTQAQIIISTYGNGIAVGLVGTREEIEPIFNRFFNWGAAAPNASLVRSNGDCEAEIGDYGDDYLHEVFEKFFYFLSTEEDMIEAIKNEYVARWQDTEISEQYKGHRKNKKDCGKKFLQDAEDAARDEFHSYHKENFMLYSKSETPMFRMLDGGASTWDSSSMTFGEIARTQGYRSRFAKA